MPNKYYDKKEAWIQLKENIDEFNNITYTCVYMIANLSNMIYPILTDSAKKIKKILGLDKFVWEETKISGDIKINNLEILYNRIDD